VIKKILVALDGSEYADHALDFALDLAEKYSAQVSLLTVIPPVLTPSYSIDKVTNYSKQVENSFSAVLSKAVEKVKKEKPALKVSTKLEKGDPAEMIIETAKREDFDLIVMGRHGLGRSKAILGSVSFKVVNRATCSVWTVK